MIKKLFYNSGFLYTKLRFFKKKDAVQNFTSILHEESRLLILMPFELEEFDKARKTMFNIKNEWPKLQISLVVKGEFLVYSELAKYFPVFELKANYINKFSLPLHKFLKPILENEYDLVIDFNKTANLTTSFIAKSIDVKYRISFIKEDADRFFNVQFDQDSVQEDKGLYLTVMRNLKMFCSPEVPKPKQTEKGTEDQKSKQTEKGTEDQKPEQTENHTEEKNNTDIADETSKIATEENKEENNNENKKQSKRDRSKYKGHGKKNR